MGRNVNDTEGVRNSIENLIRNVTLLHPTLREIEFAADLEETAVRCAVELDTGESQLVAIVLQRSCPLLLTGDKRAVRAIFALGRWGMDRRVACLEHVVADIVENGDHELLRERVCRERLADKAITNCFACSVPHLSKKDIREGLVSYIDDLRKSTGMLLLESTDLSAAIT